MVENEHKSKKVPFGEEDAAVLLERYDAATILTLLQEISRFSDPKIDWNEMVKNTATGISSARELQMLWRHLAYRHALPENLDEGGPEPLDDDSDLELELEVSPPVNNETALEASACAKVMIASSTLSESGPSSSTIETPMTISVPVCRSSTTAENTQPSNSMQGATIVFPVTVQRQTLPTVSSTEGVEAKGTGGSKLSSKRRRKAWSEEEDMQLRAAVQKCGEGNWATMSKGDDFPIKRSPTQLAQRWSILRKKDGPTNSGTNLTSSQFTAEQLATRHSLSLALDMPLKKLTAPGTTDPARTSINTSIKNPVQPINPVEASTVRSISIQHRQPSQQATLGSSGLHAKSIVPEKTMLKSNPTPDAVRATAVAVGARIVSPGDILSLQRPTQEKSAVKIMPTGNISSMKLSMSAGSHTHSKAPSNVHHGCTGVSATAVAVSPASRGNIAQSVSSAVGNTIAQAVSSSVGNTIAQAASLAVGNTVAQAAERRGNIAQSVSSAVGNTIAQAASSSVGNTIAQAASSAVGNTVAQAASSSVGNTVAQAASSSVGNTVARAASSAVGNTVAQAASSAVGNIVAQAASSSVGNTVAQAASSSVGNTVARAASSAVGNTIAQAVSSAVGNTVGQAVTSAVGNTVAQAVSSAVGNTVPQAVSSTVGNRTPICSIAGDVSVKPVNPTQEPRSSDPCVAPKRDPPVNGSVTEVISVDKSVSKNLGESGNQEVVAKNSNTNLHMEETAENPHLTVDSNCGQTINVPINDGGHLSVNESSKDEGLNQKREDLSTSVQDVSETKI